MNPQYVDDLARRILCLARVLSEERFYALGREHLNLCGGRTVQVSAVKELLIEQRRAYRLTALP